MFPVMINKDVFEALVKLLDYSEPDERKDFEARPLKDRAGHIYNSVRFVREWVRCVGESLPDENGNSRQAADDGRTPRASK